MNLQPRNLFLWLMICACAITATGQSVTLSSTPAAVNDTVRICEGTPISFSYMSSGKPTSESWAMPGGSPSSSLGPSPVSVTYASPGTYTVSVTAGFSTGSAFDQMYVVVSNDYPTVTFASSNTTLCPSDPNIDLSTLVSPAGGVFSGPGVTGNQFDPGAAGLGTHTVSYTVISPGGCSTTETLTYTVTGPDASIADANIFGVPFSNCIGPGDPDQYDLTINNTSTTANTNTSYYIDWGDGTTPYSDTILPNGTMHSYMNVGNYQITLVVAIGSCVDTATYFVFNGKNPSLGLGIGGANGCVPFTLDVPLLNVGSNPMGTVYTVDFGDGSPVQIFNHPPPDTVTYTYTTTSCGNTNIIGTQNSYHVQVIATNPCGSTQAIVSPVYVSEAPEIDFEMTDSTVCTGQSVGLVDLTTPGTIISGSSCINAYSRQWIVLPNSGYNISDPNGSNPNITFTDTGFYQVSMVVGNPCGFDTATISVCVDDVPDIDMSVSVSDQCVPATINFTNNTVLNTSCSSATSDWSVTATGSWNLSGTSTLDSLEPEITITSSGSYDFTYTVYHQCDTITWDTTIVFGGEPSLFLSQDYTFCGLDTVTFGNGIFDIDVYDSLNPIQGWNWYTIPALGSNFNGSQNTGNPTIAFDSTGTYLIVGEVWNACGTAIDTIEVTFLDKPSVPAIPDTTVCWRGDPTYWLPPHYSYQWWSVPSKYSSNSNNPTFNNINRDYTFNVAITDSLGCSDTISFNVFVNPNININFSGVTNVCVGDSTNIQANISGGTAPYAFQWSPTSGLSDSTILNPNIAVGSSAATYSLTVTDSLGCTRTRSVTITPIAPITVDAGPDTLFCFSNTLENLTGANPSGGWYTGPGIVDSLGVINPQLAGLGTHVIHYHYVDPFGCYYMDSLQVQVINPPVVTVGPDMTVCASLDTIYLTGSPYGGNWTVNQNAFLLNDSSFVPAFPGTYELIYSLGYGSCFAADTMIITVDSVPQINNVTLNNRICSGDFFSFTPSSSVNSANVQWQVIYSGGITGHPNSGTGVISGTLVNPSTTSDSVVYSLWAQGTTANSCEGDTATFTVVVDPTPSITSVAATDTLCSDETFTYVPVSSSAGTQFNWVSNPGTGISGSTGFGTGTISETLTNSSSSLSSITYTIFSSGGSILACAGDTQTVTVYIHPDPIANAGPDVAICSGDTVSLGANFQTQYSYSWSAGTYLNSTADSVVNYSRSVTSTTFDTLTLIVTDLTTGCSDEDRVIVQINPLPDAQAGPDLGVCIGDSVQIGSLPQAGFSYSWFSIPFGMVSTQANPYVSPLINTTYVLTQTNTATGCVNIDTVDVTVLPPPVANFGLSADSGCLVLSITAFDSSTVGVAHQWLVNGNPVSTQQNPNFTFTHNGNVGDSTLTITLVVSAGTGCIDSLSRDVVLHPAPFAQATASANATCGEDTLSLINNSIGNGPLTHLWTSSHSAVVIISPSDASPQVYFPQNTSGFDSTVTFTLFVTTVNGCLDSTEVQVDWYTLPSAGFTLPANACGPYSISPVTTASGSGLSYNWTISPAAINSSGVNTGSPSFDLAASTNDSVQYTLVQYVTNANGCVDSAVERVTVYPTPNAQFTTSATDSCGVFSPGFVNTSSTNQSGMGLSTMTFSWTTSDGQVSTDSIPNFSFTNTGVQDSIYSISLVVTNAFGCSDSTSTIVTVHPDAYANIAVGQQANCAPFVLDSSSATATQVSTANSGYRWKVFDLSGNLLSTSTGATGLNYTLNNGGDSVIVRLIAESAFGCQNDSTEELFFTIENPMANFSAIPDSGCSPLTVQFNDSSTAGVNHSWYVNGTLFSNQANPNLTLFNSGTTDSTVTIKLIIAAGSGCLDSTEQTVTIFGKPVADFTPSTSALCGMDSVDITNSSYGPSALTYQWSISGGGTLSNDTISNPRVYIPDNQSGFDSTYLLTLVVTSVNGCSDTLVDTLISTTRPVAQMAPLANFCGSDTLSADAIGLTAQQSAQWSISPNATILGGNTANAQFIIPASTNDSVQYQITLQVTDANGCIDTLSQNVTSYPLPTADFSPSTRSICDLSFIQFTNTSTPNQSGMNRNSMSFEWTFSDGQSSTDSVPTITFANATGQDTTYYVQLVAYNAWGCSDTLVDSIIVHPNPLAQIAVSQAANCAPFAIDTSNISAVQWPTQNSTYNWEIVDPVTQTVLSNSTGVNSLSYTLANPGDSVEIRLIVQSPFGCNADTATQMAYAFEDPRAGFLSTAIEGCSPLSVSVVDTSINGSTREWFVDGVSAGSVSNPSFTFTNSGTASDSTYTIQLVVTSGVGCSDTVERVITVFAAPVVSFTSSPACEGDDVFFVNQSTALSGIASYAWDFGTGTSNLENPQHAFGGAGSYPVSLTVTDSNGCTATYLDTAVIFPSPIADLYIPFTCGVDTVCVSQPFSLIDTSAISASGSITSWWWDVNNDGIGDYNTSSAQQTYTTSGWDTITLVVSTALGCPDTLTKAIFIEEPPVADFTLSNNKGCGPLSVTATNQSTGTIDTYQWEVFAEDASGNKVVIYTSIQEDPNPIPALPAGANGDSTYFVTLTATNCCGFSRLRDTIIVETAPQPGILVLSPTGCSPYNALFQLDGQNNGGADYLVVNYGDGSGVIDTIFPSIQILPNGDTTLIWGQLNHTFVYNGTNPDTTYHVTVTGFNSCGNDSASVPVTVTPAAVQAFFQMSPLTGCAPHTVNYQDASFGATQISWCFDFDSTQNVCNNFVSNQSSGSFTYTQPGIYTVALFAEDGCSADTAYLQVEVFPTPVADFSHNQPVCENDVVTFTNLSTIASGFIASYEWDFGDSTTSTLENPTHLYSGYGTYQVTLITTSVEGCVDSVSRSLTINESPKVSFSGQDRCIGEQPVQFIDSTLMTQGVIAQTEWRFGDGNTSTSPNPQHTYAAAGVYQVTLIQTTQAGCADSAQITVTIFPDPVAGFTTSQISGGACGTPQTFEFTNAATGNNTLFWDFTSVSNPGVNTSTQQQPTFTYTQAGVYVVSQIVENISGCSDTLRDTLIIAPKPEPLFSLDNAFGCAPVEVNFQDLSTYNFNGSTGVTDWYWDFGDGNFSTDQNPTYVYETPGIYHVSLVVTTESGCSDTLTMSSAVEVYSVPEADFSFSTESGKIVQFNNLSTYSDSGTVFSWDFGDGNTSGQRSPTHVYDVDLFEKEYSFDVCLIVTNSAGCADTICYQVDLEGYLLYVPNAFAPDLVGVGDGSVFLPKGHSIAKYRLRIFDTFGNLIFETTSLDENGIPNEPWNGQLHNHGEILPQGAFAWRVEAVFRDGTVWPGQKNANGRTYDFGTVTLIR